MQPDDAAFLERRRFSFRHRRRLRRVQKPYSQRRQIQGSLSLFLYLSLSLSRSVSLYLSLSRSPSLCFLLCENRVIFTEMLLRCERNSRRSRQRWLPAVCGGFVQRWNILSFGTTSPRVLTVLPFAIAEFIFFLSLWLFLQCFRFTQSCIGSVSRHSSDADGQIRHLAIFLG